MTARTRWLIPIILLAGLAVWIDLQTNPGIHLTLGSLKFNRDIRLHEGLDLQGGLQVLLEADLPEGQTPDRGAMSAARDIVEQRVNALGVTEPLVQAQGDRRIVVELPGISNPDEAIATLRQTGLLEFVDVGAIPITAGTPVETDCLNPTLVDCGAVPTPAASPTAEAGAGAAEPTPTAEAPAYHTVMTGAALQSAVVSRDEVGNYLIDFTLTGAGSKIFADHTSANVGRYLAIVLDKKVISSPQIQSAITGGRGQISGNFTQESANGLAVQLRYGALPVPLKVVTTQTVGATLGEDSVRKSALAGAIGLGAVAAFMLLYYRLPGALADVALLIYAALVFALFKWIPVTLTLPGIAGFALSVGVAVDANILIFERMKEELRAGRRLERAVEEGHHRAWPSIRDSNISTLITCGILFWFGSAFGASIVKGFALTLAIGVIISLFTAIIVTRTLLHLVLDNMEFEGRHGWFGI